MTLYTITIKCSGEETETSLPLTFSEEELALFRDFSSAAEKMNTFSALRMPQNYMAVVQPRDGTPEVEFGGPSDEQLSALLHVLRPLLLQKDPFSFQRITPILKRRLRHQSIFLVLKEEDARFRGTVWQKELKVSSGEKLLNTEEMFLEYVNAFEYHRGRCPDCS